MAKRRVKHIKCPNCDYSFNGIDNYCPNCGQENHTHKLPVKHFILEVVEGYFHLDTKMINTLKDMVLKPGLITKNYNLGKRARYVSPIRFYIFVSFVFFLILSLENPEKGGSSARSNKSEGFTITVSTLDQPERIKDYKKLAANPELDNSTIDRYLDSVGVATSWYNKTFIRNYIRFKTGHLTPEDLRHKTRKNLSIMMFLLMPLVAFFLYILFYKKKLYYSEHLIFSIHFHTLAFIVLSIWLLCRPFLDGVWLLCVFLPIIFIHGIWSMKVIYQQSIVSLFVKVFFLGLLYSITLIIFYIITVLSSLI
jgi:hypothetical protein